MPPRRIMLTVMYDGSGFCGWQKQEPPEAPPLRTAQGALESAVRRAVRAPVNVVGASRTDSGVHAVGQVAAFTAPANMTIPVERLHRAINRYLDPDIAVIAAREVDPSFQPIGDAVRKCYRYTIHNAELRPIFDRSRVYHCWRPLDADAMNRAAQIIVGKHDFASFAHVQHGRESTVRRIESLTVERRGERVNIEVVGDGFLYNMVRIIAGTLVEIGRGHWLAEKTREILAARDRSAAGTTLGPEGLCLVWIEYPEVKLTPPGDGESLATSGGQSN